MTAGPRLLVVDDDENDLRMIAGVLDGGAGAAHFLHDGAEALDYLQGRGAFSTGAAEAPRLILLDLHMPRVNGWEVLRQVKADTRLRTIPVVVFSSSARESDVAQSYALGANAYVVKPIAFESFRDAVRAIEGFWLRCNQAAPESAAPAAAGAK